MLSSPWAVSGVFLVPACGSCIVKPCIFCICNMESQAFEVYSFSALRFDFYTLLLYCVCTNCESLKSCYLLRMSVGLTLFSTFSTTFVLPLTYYYGLQL